MQAEIPPSTQAVVLSFQPLPAWANFLQAIQASFCKNINNEQDFGKSQFYYKDLAVGVYELSVKASLKPEEKTAMPPSRQ